MSRLQYRSGSYSSCPSTMGVHAVTPRLSFFRPTSSDSMGLPSSSETELIFFAASASCWKETFVRAPAAYIGGYVSILSQTQVASRAFYVARKRESSVLRSCASFRINNLPVFNTRHPFESHKPPHVTKVKSIAYKEISLG